MNFRCGRLCIVSGLDQLEWPEKSRGTERDTHKPLLESQIYRLVWMHKRDRAQSEMTAMTLFFAGLPLEENAVTTSATRVMFMITTCYSPSIVRS